MTDAATPDQYARARQRAAIRLERKRRYWNRRLKYERWAIYRIIN